MPAHETQQASGRASGRQDARRLVIQPLTPKRWPDLEKLFGQRGACGGCWCMFWRLSRQAFEAGKDERNRRAFKALVDSAAEPGLLAYDGNEPIGWCALAPRDAYPALQRSRLLKPIDAQPVWSVSCLFVARSHRRRGVSVELLKAAADFVRRKGGRIVEGYPQEPRNARVPDVFAWTGLAAAFLRAGYAECARPSPTRPIMRLTLRPFSQSHRAQPWRGRDRDHAGPGNQPARECARDLA